MTTIMKMRRIHSGATGTSVVRDIDHLPPPAIEMKYSAI
jgi:hypothetical protein